MVNESGLKVLMPLLGSVAIVSLFGSGLILVFNFNSTGGDIEKYSQGCLQLETLPELQLQ